MKAKLIFDLNDPDDRGDFAIASKANNLGLALWEIVHNSRKAIEWSIEASEEPKTAAEGVEMVYNRIFEILEENDINIDSLIR